MFEAVRRHRTWLLPILTLAAFIPFVFSGIYGFTRYFGQGDSVARIDGTSISQQELDDAQRDRIARMMEMLPHASPEMLNTPQIRAATLDDLLSKKALDHEAGHAHLQVSDMQLRGMIASIPEFQRNGQFDYGLYRQLLAGRGYGEREFEARLRTDIERQTLESGVGASAFLPRAVSERLFALEDQRREIRVLPFRPQNYLSQVHISDDAVKAAYDANRDAYRSPEHAKVQYLVLSLDQLAAGVPIRDADVRAEYDANKARWGATEQVRASHILVAVPPGASAAAKEKARLLAEKVWKDVRDHPGDFAELARKYSQDPGSAAKGGDLGWFGRGVMPKPFEKAAFSLKDGETSGVVETPFGFHILRVTGVRGAQAKPFDEVRASIEQQMRKDAAAKLFSVEAEQFSDFVYENADGLSAAAAKFHLPIQSLAFLPRGGVSQPALAAVFTPSVLEAVFAPDSVEQHHNTKAIDIGNNTLVSVHVMQYVPAAAEPLDTVRAQIEAKLRTEAAEKLARQAGEARLAELRNHSDDKGFEAPRQLARQDLDALPAAAIGTIMNVPAKQLPAYVGVEEADGSYAVVHILSESEVAPGTPQIQARRVDAWTERVAAAEDRAYVRGLRDRFGAKILRPDLLPDAAAKTQ